jgi:hypothetical protein
MSEDVATHAILNWRDFARRRFFRSKSHRRARSRIASVATHPSMLSRHPEINDLIVYM